MEKPSPGLGQGITSGVQVVNPGFSIWDFTVLARLFDIHRPTELAFALRIFAGSWDLTRPAVCLLVRFESNQQREAWLWAFFFSLAMVNPFLIYYQRKIWPQAFQPFFGMVSLMGWWNRGLPLGAFVWGRWGALLGRFI
jgi:hypothetical protein